MITFKQYLNEGFVDKALGTAIGLGAIAPLQRKYEF
jgi:hypothetical protein